jgi:hypothetical protein
MGSKRQTSLGAKNAIARGIGFGIAGGLAGMIAMDLVMAVLFLIIGLPIYTYLEIIGSVLGGGVPLGVVLHILLSLILGLIFFALVFNIGFLRVTTIRKGLTVGTVAGAVTIVACVPFAIITNIPMAEILSFSALPHIVFGMACGLVVGYGMTYTQ